MNIGAQDIFLVFFSILFGVMLQSLPGGLFPLGRLRKGWRYSSGEYNTEFYRQWLLTTLASIFFVNILPAYYCFRMLNILKDATFTYTYFWDVLAVFWSSLGVFGFYRLYYMVIIKCPNILEESLLNTMKCRGLSFDLWSHCFWMLVYIFPGALYFIYDPSYALVFLIILVCTTVLFTWVFTSVSNNE